MSLSFLKETIDLILSSQLPALSFPTGSHLRVEVVGRNHGVVIIDFVLENIPPGFLQDTLTLLLMQAMVDLISGGLL